MARNNYIVQRKLIYLTYNNTLITTSAKGVSLSKLVRLGSS